MFKKLALLLIATFVLSVTILIAVQPAAAGSNSNQIMFSIKGGTIYWVVINGTNQRNQSTQYVWADAYRNNWRNGAAAVTTAGWWWKDYMEINFYSQEIGYGRCVIDSLKIASYSNYTMVQYDPATHACSGDAGSAGRLQSLEALAHAYLHEEDYGKFDEIVRAHGAVGCGTDLLNGLASQSYWIPLKSKDCWSGVVDIFNDIASHYNKRVYQPYR